MAPIGISADGRQKETESMDKYTIVGEDGPHEGTWLAWPHHHTDGAGTLMACESSVVSPGRNRGLAKEYVERRLRQCLGVSNFIWLKGTIGEDITDAHIDGIARFYDSHTIIAVARNDFADLYEGIDMADYDVIASARNADGEPYRVVQMPLTRKNVRGLGYKGSYLNFYVGNTVVLMPAYGDANDSVAVRMLTELYPGRRVVPIDVTKLYKHGGMLHCVTRQQPAARQCPAARHCGPGRCGAVAAALCRPCVGA